MVAQALASRMIAAAKEGSSQELLDWTAQTCERYAGHAGVLSMFASSCATVRESLRRSCCDLAFDNLVLVERTIAAIVSRHQANLRDGEGPPPLDEVDLAIEAFIAKLDETDAASTEHSRAVSLWCRRIARSLGLRAEECADVARSGLLHDVGKTFTPKEVLFAPRALSSGEWATVREHSLLGAAMIERVPLLRPFTAVARSHHERVDGKGYPDGLPARELPLAVRIVTVVDSFTAMIARRPYRLPMSPTIALKELRRHSGTQFDPDVVEAMIKVVERC
jgi:HD-GYP domain-containing protein (c-di-GMP phosphodiesterase class II)